MKGYKTIKDYKKLKELLLAGKEIVCFVTWNFHLHYNSEPHMVTDICMAKYMDNENEDYKHFMIMSRGHVFLEHYPTLERVTFEEACEQLQVEFIEPNE